MLSIAANRLREVSSRHIKRLKHRKSISYITTSIVIVSTYSSFLKSSIMRSAIMHARVYSVYEGKRKLLHLCIHLRAYSNKCDLSCRVFERKKLCGVLTTRRDYY